MQIFEKDIVKNRIFIRYIAIMLITAVIPLAIGGITMVATMKKANTQAMKDSYRILVTIQRSLTRELDNIRQRATDLALDSDIAEYEYMPNNANYSKMTEIIGKLSLSSEEAKFYNGIYLYVADSRVVLYNGAKYTDRQFYNTFLQKSSESYDEWTKRMRQRQRSDFSFDEEELFWNGYAYTKSIQYTQSYPVSTGETVKGSIVVMIDYDKLTEYYCSVYEEGDKALYILNNADNVMYSVGSDRYSLTDKYMTMNAGRKSTAFSSVAAFKTTGSRYTFISIENMGIMEQGIKKVIFVDVIFIFVLLIFGIFASMLAAYKMSLPMIKIGSMLGMTENEKEIGIDDINERLETLMENTESADEMLQRKKESIKENILKLLLNGNSHDIKDIKEELKRVGISFDKDGYIVAIVKLPIHNIHDMKTATMMKYIVSQTIRETLEHIGRVEILDDGWKEIVTILNIECGENVDNSIIKSFTTIEEFVSVELGTEIEINIGGIHGDLADIYNSYMEACECSEYRIYSGTGRILSYPKIKSLEKDKSYVYTAEQENEFIRNVVMGNEAAALENLDNMIATHNDGSVVMLRCLFFNLLGTMLKILNSGNVEIAEEIGGVGHFDDLFACRNMAELRETIQVIISDICQNINRHGGNKKTNLRRAMLEYIESHYFDNEMSLERIADEFNLNFTYVSHFFKEQLGENFSEYLTKIRIEKAKEFLKNTDLTIGEIAIKVGYANSTVLIKNFKKIQGITPGKFRETGEQK